MVREIVFASLNNMKNILEKKIANYFLSIPRSTKRSLVILVDICCSVLSTWWAYCIRFDAFVVLTSISIIPIVISIGLLIPIFSVLGLYRAIFRYNSIGSIVIIARAIFIYWIIYATVFGVFGISSVPRSIGFIQPLFLLVLIGTSRVIASFFFDRQYQQTLRNISRSKVLIYGAGAAGRQLAAAIFHAREIDVVGFLDDDSRLHGQVLDGLRIYDPKYLEVIAGELQISDVLLAMPNCSRKRRAEILLNIRESHVAVRTLPALSDLAQGKVSLSDIRELDINDLLGREPVEARQSLLAKKISGRVVLITGAGGSIGSELCRQALEMHPKVMLLVDQSEFNLYTIHQELEAKLANSRFAHSVVIVPLLASVTDNFRMQEIMSAWRPETVYHAAAYKHVPLVEHNPIEGIKNNIFGTLNLAQVAVDNDVLDFVLISTDKAVRPTNIMGASKRLAEEILQALSVNTSPTCFSMVRFGNVLGSSGSVVPKFREQIRNGGPITITHHEITRYFMTIPEAAQLVIQAGAMARGGDVFLLNMGEPIRIIDLANRMVELSGLSMKSADNPNGEIDVVVTGLRPGEKLFEELLIGESSEGTDHPWIMRAKEEFTPWNELRIKLSQLKYILDINDSVRACELMQEMVAGYTPEGEIVDWIYLHKSS